MARLKIFTILAALLVPSMLLAQEQDRDERTSGDPTLQAMEDGSFSPLTTPARVGSTQAYAWGLGGYDSSHKGAIVDSALEVRLWGPIALRGGSTYSNSTNRLRPSVGARAQVLRQNVHGLDGAIGVLYKAEGFTEAEGEIETVVSIGRRFEHLSLVGNLVYGQDPEGNERDGELRLTLSHLRGRFSFGFDARTRLALGTQRRKAATTEPTFDAMAGALATAAIGPLAVFAEVGPSAFALAGARQVGAVAFAGVGSAF